MFASRSLGALPGGGNSLDVPVAALAGLAVAFLAFVAPADLLHSLVGSSGLPSLIPSAAPPLGIKARIGIGAAGAVTMFAIAFLILRALDRFGTQRREEDETPAEREPPRLRRRDFHPDAPPRPPLLAAHELGEPELELNQVAPEPPAPRPEASPLLARKPERPAPQPQPEPVQSHQPEPVASDPPAHSEPAADEPPQLDQAGAYALSQRNWSDFEPGPEIADTDSDAWPAAQPPVSPPDVAEAGETMAPAEKPAAAPEPAWQEPAPAPQPWAEDDHSPMAYVSEPVDPSRQAEVQQEPQPFEQDPEPQPEAAAREPEPVEAPWPAQAVPPMPEAEPAEAEWHARPAEPVPAPDPLEDARLPLPIEPAPEPIEASWRPQVEAAPEVPGPIAAEPAEDRPRPPEGSIAELMERLEQGLARHRSASTPALAPHAPAASSAAPAPRLQPDPSDDRLQNAIESLQRFASRQD